MKTTFNFLTIAVCLSTMTVTKAQVTTPADIKGSPYLDEAYVEAEISFANNTRTVPARYNAYKDLIEYKQNGVALVLDPAPTIKRVQLGEESFVVEKYEADGKMKTGYFEMIDSGKVSLYAKKEVRYIPPRKGAAMDGKDLPAEFRRTPDTFYLKVGDGKLEEIRNIKSMIALFPDKQDELSKFVKKEKISTRNEDELRQLMKYYNEL